MGMAFWVRLALAIPKSLWLTRRHGQGPDAVRLGGWLRDVEVRPVRGHVLPGVELACAGAGNLPRNLACLTNAAISIVRREGHFEYLPPANRHYAARPQEALDAVMNPPSR